MRLWKESDQEAGIRSGGRARIVALDVDGKTVAFDGEWKKAKMTEADYTKAYQQHDEAYSRMLQALIETLKKAS